MGCCGKEYGCAFDPDAEGVSPEDMARFGSDECSADEFAEGGESRASRKGAWAAGVAGATAIGFVLVLVG